MGVTKQPFVAEAKLKRIENDLWYATATSKDAPGTAVERFGYNHGDMTVVDTTGKSDLLFEHNGDRLRSNACRALWQMAPAVVKELIRGYRLARAAGLLGDNKVHPDVVTLIGIAGVEQLRDTLKKANRQPDGLGQL